MGNKQGYASAILRTLGLRSGSGAARYLWCEPDDGCRLLLTCYTDADLRSKAAEIIRGWKDEDPRALWERLRAEGPVKSPPVDPREVARWCYVQRSANSGLPLREVAGVWAPWWPAGQKMIRRGRVGPEDGKYQVTDQGMVDRLSTLPTLPASIFPDARDIDPPQLPPGSVVYIDPPYVGTTGYAHDLGRGAVCELAERWASAGAWVVISEAEPLAELDGWHQVEITGERVGQKRTFSKQQREYLTMSRPPLWRPAVQSSLFSMAAK
tara:strand:+ start:33 stop:833 length:801 start_codon:yes stop_codon:yes gene_type:complete